MIASLLKGILTVGAPVALIALWVVLLMRRRRTVGSILQLVGISGLMVGALTLVCDAFGLFPALHWEEPGSIGHYIGVIPTAVGVPLLFIGILLRRRELGVR